MNISYQSEPAISVADFLSILRRSTLASRRPVNEVDTLRDMLANADVLITARTEDNLVGISRAITDFSYCTYLSDIAVDTAFQRRGIGQELVRRTHAAAGLHTTLILLSAPQAESYYPHIGMQPHSSCWTIARTPPAPRS